MELIYKRNLVHYLGTSEREDNGHLLFDFAFRDASGEKFSITLSQDEVPNRYFACNDMAFENALQEILDRN